jgi:lipopolysaccharide transport system ATP-binding protein
VSDDIAIRVKCLGKKYTIGGHQEKYQTFRDAIINFVKAPVRKWTRRSADQSTNEFWALKDVSFEVKKGEVIGIIGRNGAGKSTLLKILSRITSPTEGEIDIYGRVGSLLEVGTGFHPELTGRENIFLSGSILGMRKREIEEKFDEIVKFAEIEKFIETPVKRYSSGMYVRLAFAVAAFLEPEILLVDEVLAVGDAAFQKKCLGKMGDVAKEGRTVLFVSHNMGAITRLCQRGILLDSGNLSAEGSMHDVVKTYLQSDTGFSATHQYSDSKKRPGNEIVHLIEVRVIDSEGNAKESHYIGDCIGIEMKYEVLTDGFILIPNYHFFTSQGVYAFVVGAGHTDIGKMTSKKGFHVVTGWIPANLLNEETYYVGVAISTYNPKKVHFFEKEAVVFRAIDSPDNITRGGWVKNLPGVVRPLIMWDYSLKE